MKKFNNSDFINTINERGFIHQITDKENLQKELASGSLIGYIGFDCTAPSLHVGSLVPKNRKQTNSAYGRRYNKSWRSFRQR